MLKKNLRQVLLYLRREGQRELRPLLTALSFSLRSTLRLPPDKRAKAMKASLGSFSLGERVGKVTGKEREREREREKGGRKRPYGGTFYDLLQGFLCPNHSMFALLLRYTHLLPLPNSICITQSG